MKNFLNLNVNQQFSFSPQLQQAIRVLQLSTIDLNHEIQQQVESNPLLEIELREPELTTSDDLEKNSKEIEDIQWNNFYMQKHNIKEFHEDLYLIDQIQAYPPTLREHLLSQLQLTTVSEKDKLIGMAIIESLDENGILSVKFEELIKTLVNNLKCSENEIEAVRKIIQQFDPVGCASRDLKETLFVQIKYIGFKNKYTKLAKKIISENLELLAKHKYSQLCKIYSLSPDFLKECILIIKSLNPRPGIKIASNYPENIVPDLVVKKINSEWIVEINPYALPNLSINSYYASLIKCAKNITDIQFLKGRLQEAQWLIKNIKSRQETLLKVANYIVQYQKNFFEYGPEAMKPLILQQVAQNLNLHESTISRITTQKYLYSSRGLYELKYFFSSHVSTLIGGECSATAIQAIIKKIIKEEDSKKPLSDNKIAKIISAQGINIARRTVAKYRQKMNIPGASVRKYIH